MKNDDGDRERELSRIVPEVEKAARHAAVQVLGPGALELIEEVVAEVYLRLVRAWRRSPPENPVGWAFTVGVNYARRLGKQVSIYQQRHTEIDNPEVSILDLKSNSEPELGEFSTTINVEAAIEALDRLVALANHTVHDVGGDDDRRIFVLFHVRGQSWEQIAAAVNLTTTAVRRRYYRLIRRAAGVIREHTMKDPLLSERCSTILTDDQMFRCALLSVLNVVGRKGFPAIREILESFLSE